MKRSPFSTAQTIRIEPASENRVAAIRKGGRVSMARRIPRKVEPQRI
jgi:hypothetical protein